MSRFAGAVAVLALVLSACGGSEPPTPVASVQAPAPSYGVLEERLQRLDDAIFDARPRRRSSMVALRASAAAVGDELSGVRGELRALQATAAEESSARRLDSALGRLDTLVQALEARELRAGRIEAASAAAQVSLRDVRELAVPDLATDDLVADLRAARRHPPRSAPVAAAAPGPSRTIAYRDYVGPAFQAKLPTGEGWSSPAQTEPTPGRLFRTSVRGPGGLFAIVDFTPYETAKFGGRFQSRRVVGQTAFGTAVEYVFQGGSLPECQRTRCVDYIINDTATGQGFGVLAGGADFDAAASIARTVMESVIPRGSH